MKKWMVLLMMMPMMLMAQEAQEKDTIWVNDALEAVSRDEATMYALQHIEDDTITAFIYYSREEKPNVMRERYYRQDGTLIEETILTYGKGRYPEKTYLRRLYYPNGQLRYEEAMSGKDQKIVYYNENGKVVKRPKQKVEPYMTMPEFPGGQEALFQYLSANVKYPKIAQENGIQGRVIVQFVVAKDGRIENAEVVRSGGDPSLDNEALRVIRKMPRWIPGKQRGKLVRVKYTVPVNFRLH